MTQLALLAQSSGSNSALVAFGIYTLGVFALAFLSNRLLQSKSFLSEYFLGSRGLGVWAFALTFAATSASGGSFMGFPSRVYSHGWSLALWIGSYMLVPVVSMGLLAKRINQVARISDAITVPDVLRNRYESVALGTLATLLIVFFMVFNLVAQFKAGANILKTLLRNVAPFEAAQEYTAGQIAGAPFIGQAEAGYLMCLLFFGIAVIIYTSYGGFRAVVWTDVMQGIVMVFGVVVMLPLALHFVGGLSSATSEMAQMTPPRRRLVMLEARAPVQEDVPIKLGTWILDRGDGEDGPRVFRTANKAVAVIEKGKTQVEMESSEAELIPVLQITTPSEVQRLAERIADGKLADTLQIPVDIDLHRFARFTIAEAAVERREIPAGTWFSIEAQHKRVFRTRLAAVIPAGEVQAELVDPARRLEQSKELERHDIPVERLRLESEAEPSGPTLDAGISARITGDYVRGDDSPGVYVTGPGPHRDDISGFLPLSLAVSFFFMWTFSGAGQPSNMVRLMAFNSSQTLRRAIFTVAVYYSLIYFPLVVIFCCARLLLPGMEIEPDRIMPEMARYLTAAAGWPWLAGLLVAAPFAAVMSTVDSFLLMISSAVVRDVYQRDINPEASEKTIKRLTYTVTAVVGVAALAGAVNPPAYLQDIIVYTGSGLSGSFLMPVALSLYWPRMNAAGAIAGMASGFATHLSLYVSGYVIYGRFRPLAIYDFDPLLPAFLTSLLVGVVVSLLTPPPPEHLTRKFFVKH